MKPIEQLGFFAARVEELRQRRLLRNGFAPGFSLNWTQMKGLSFKTNDPDEEDLRSFLMTFRQFVSPREPVALNRIYNLCHLHLKSDQIKGYLLESRAAWKQAMRSQGWKLVIDGREISPEYAADLWINGHYFHSDDDKRRELLRLVPPVMLAVRQQFLHFVADATRQVLYVGNVVHVGLREDLFVS